MIRRILLLLLFALTAYVQATPAAEPVGPGVAGVLPAASKASLEDNRARPYLFADPGFYQWGGTPILAAC